MDIRPFAPDDIEVVQAVVDLVNAAQKVDAPFNHPQSVEEFVGYARYGWDGDVPETYGAWVGDELVALAEVHTTDWDNMHLAWVGAHVHPDRRGRGHGARVLAFLAQRSRELGRTSIGADAWETTSGPAFLERRGLTRRSAAIKRRQTLARVDREALDRLHDEAAVAAADYELSRFEGRTPADLLDEVAAIAAAMNDAPTDALDVEDEVFSPERIAAYEAAQEARGRRLHRVMARHRGSGELAGHTVVAVAAARPWIGEQHDTSVVRAHRGHRLGLLLKVDMMRLLAEVEPSLATVDTWNTESNGFMIAVNETLGYQVLGRELQFQGDLSPDLS
jgi:GNAT superfamily N-acetyltransferase